MPFASPLALLGLLFVPAVVAMYLLRLRRTETIVPSTLLWQRLAADVEANAPWQRLRRSLLFLFSSPSRRVSRTDRTSPSSLENLDLGVKRRRNIEPRNVCPLEIRVEKAMHAVRRHSELAPSVNTASAVSLPSMRISEGSPHVRPLSPDRKSQLSKRPATL